MGEMSYRASLEQLKGRKNQLLRELEEAESKSSKLFLQARHCEEAQLTIQEVAQITQKSLEYHISELVTLAMASVFDDPYKLIVEFVPRRNRTEADLWFERAKGKPINLKDEGEGGAVDVAAFALRVSLWSLSPQRTRNLLILDEPMKWLKGGDLPELGAEMMQEVSSKIGLQIICVSHVEDQIAGADKRVFVKLKGGRSEIRYE
jgi:predicted ATPase